VIKPEEIPPELVRHYLNSFVSRSWPEKIAADMNAAIQAGVVVEPHTGPSPDVLMRVLRLTVANLVEPEAVDAEMKRWIEDAEAELEKERE
jgi:hypothetical protein